MKKILLIGAGNMGSAIAESLLSQNFIAPENLCIADPSSEKTQKFLKKGCTVSQNPEDFLPEADLVILATKPQVLRELLDSWKEKFLENVTLLSIAAGISVAEIQKFSQQKKVVRVMPNTPLLVEKGVSGYFFSPEISDAEKPEISQMMQCFGLAIECETEEKINAITALSGSGPAYFFRLLESMAEQGEKFGFRKKEAEDIALQTLLGAGILAEKSDDDFGTLRKKVTSKGGTTEAALNFFEENNLSEIFQEGMQAAKKRAEEL